MNEQITSAAELDALPVGSVILDRGGIAWQKCDYTDRRVEGRQPPTVWASASYLFDYLSDELIVRLPTPAGQTIAPFTVLYRPDQPQRDPGEVEALRAEVAALGARIADMSWGLNPDRMGQ